MASKRGQQRWPTANATKYFWKLNRWQTAKLYLHYLAAMQNSGTGGGRCIFKIKPKTGRNRQQLPSWLATLFARNWIKQLFCIPKICYTGNFISPCSSPSPPTLTHPGLTETLTKLCATFSNVYYFKRACYLPLLLQFAPDNWYEREERREREGENAPTLLAILGFGVFIIHSLSLRCEWAALCLP